MEQEPVLKAHNKEEYPPMHTGEADTSLRCKVCIKTVFFALIMWCSTHQSSYAQIPDSVGWARNDTDELQEGIARNKDYYMYILVLDNKILTGNTFTFDEVCRAIPKTADEIQLLWGNNEIGGQYRGQRIDQLCFNQAIDNPRSDIIGRYFTAAYCAEGHYRKIYNTDCYLIWKKHPQQTEAVLSMLFDKQTTDYFHDMFEEWSRKEIDDKQKIQRSSLWETDTKQHIVGSVVDNTNNRPIENVKVELLRDDDSSIVCSTTTNRDGKYGLAFPRLTHNDGTLVLFKLRITAYGYQSLWVGVDMSMIIECQSTIPHIPSNFSLKPIH